MNFASGRLNSDGNKGAGVFNPPISPYLQQIKCTTLVLIPQERELVAWQQFVDATHKDTRII